MAKILVTGGAGFIGAHTTRKLLDRGDEVVIVDDFNDRYDPALKRARLQQLVLNTYSPRVVEADIADIKQIPELFAEEKFDKVLHLAAWAAVQTSIERPRIYTYANIDGTVNILEESHKHNVGSVVFASSSSVYGGREDGPFRESDDISRPISPYAATKACGELMCSTWNHLYDLPISCLRFFTVYGPWGRPEMALFKFTAAIVDNKPIQMRGRNTERDFTYIDDCVQGVIAALDNPNGFQIYNLGESDAVPLPRFIAAIESALGSKAQIEEVPLPVGDVPRTLADISKAKRELGYNPQTKIEEGVKEFISWYKSWYIPHFQEAPL